jgi:hypothetical protein
LAATAFTIGLLQTPVAHMPPLPRLLVSGGGLAACYMLVLLYGMRQKPFYASVIRDSRIALTGVAAPPATTTAV